LSVVSGQQESNDRDNVTQAAATQKLSTRQTGM
jgi:hypothetical protein